jgi:hypothetical protein
MVHLPCIEGVARIIEGTPGDAMVQNPALVVRPQNLEGKFEIDSRDDRSSQEQ